MRTADELVAAAFREKLSADEDDVLVRHYVQVAEAERDSRKKTAGLKQAAFFASRAFDKGARDAERIERYIRILSDVQRLAPSASFRRKVAEMKSALAGKGSHERVLRRLARLGEAGPRSALATDAQLDAIEASLDLKLPPSYRAYLKQHVHRQIGTFEPWTAAEIDAAARESWSNGLEPHLLPFLDDNADLFCFDMRPQVEEPPIVFRPHDGISDEIWPNFAAWVEECWIGELED